MKSKNQIPEDSDVKDIRELEKVGEDAKFSLNGATLYGINAVIGSGIFLLPKDIYKDLGPASLVAMFTRCVLSSDVGSMFR